MKNNKSASLFPRELVIESLKQAFVKLNPRTMIKNPIMFTVEVATWVMLLVIVGIAVTGDTTQGSVGYIIAIYIFLFVKSNWNSSSLMYGATLKSHPDINGFIGL